MPVRILYAGDSPVGGAANYLLGILGSLRVYVKHLPPSEKMTASLLKKNWDLIILSDYSAKQISSACQKQILQQTKEGCGLLMIGGWGSFSGPFGKWKGSLLETVLPVICKAGDDRTNFPGGASVCLKNSGSFLKSRWFQNTPAICGMNHVFPKSNSKILLTAKKILSDGKKIRFDSKEYPLLIVSQNQTNRVAALTTDLAPHWCGGLVDWGTTTEKLPVNSKIQVQVGNYYIAFVSSLLFWLIRKK